MLKKASCNFPLYADIKCFENHTTLFKSPQQSLATTGSQQNNLLHHARPDTAIETRGTLTVTELTCPYKTNATKSHQYKETRYKKHRREPHAPSSNFRLIFLELTSLGFLAKNIKTFMNFLKSTININERYLIAKLQKVAIRCFYLTYYRTYKNWNKPNLIS